MKMKFTVLLCGAFLATVGLAAPTITSKPVSDVTVSKDLSPTMFTYSGSANCPSVKVRDTAIAPNLTVTAYAAGDVDGDGLLSENDVTLIKKYNAYQKLNDENKEKFSSYNLTGDALTAADVNKDGQVNADDVTALQDKFGCYELVEGTDYTIAYSDNTKVGTGHVTITGKGNYGGTVTLDFEIQKATIGDGDELGSGTVPAGGKSKYDSTVVYDGTGHTVNTNSLVAAKIGSDSFTVAYSLDGANGWQVEPFVYTNAGQYVFWYRLQNENYNDYVHQVQLTITPKPISDSTVAKTLTPASFVYDGTAKSPTVTITDESVFRWQFVAAYAAGDVNGDGVLTQADADAIDQYVAYLEMDDDMKPLFEKYALTGDALAAADYNGDGVVDAADVAGLEASFVTLKDSVDYIVISVEDNLDPGTARVMVAGCGNYGEECGVDFAIEPVVVVKNLEVTPMPPWGVALDFDVDGVVKVAKTAELVVTAITSEGAVTNLAMSLTGDVMVTNGAHRVYWNMAEDGIEMTKEMMTVVARYVSPRYCIVDLSGGANASTYPVKYRDTLPRDGFNTTEYKTNKLVLRRCLAGRDPLGRYALTRNFYAGVFEVTQKQWELVMGSNPSSPSSAIGDMKPVMQVSYNMVRGSVKGAKWPASNEVDGEADGDANDSFLGRLRKRTGLDFDLPTEAQWEYTCRAGTTTVYSYGDIANDDYMWHGDNSGNTLHEVGTKLPNPWGLYDMHGSVWEHCLDWACGMLSGKDPVGRDSGVSRLIRGGCFLSCEDATWDTSSIRNYPYPYKVDASFGFRLFLVEP